MKKEIKTEDTKTLRDLYYDPEKGFVSADKLYKKAVKDQGFKGTLSDVKQYLAKQFVNQVTRTVKKPTKFNSIYSSRPGSNVQIDIMVYDRYEYHKYKYIL